MKSITFASGTIVTGSAVAEALVDYVAGMSASGASTSIEIPVLEANGTVAVHTIVLGAAVQFDIADIDGVVSEADEEARFPVPEMPDVNMVAVIPTDENDADAENFNRAIADMDSVLDDPTAS
jgi:hypothetical protein